VKKPRRKEGSKENEEKNDDEDEMGIEDELDTGAERGLYPYHLVEYRS
jgi:hypothetical protein